MKVYEKKIEYCDECPHIFVHGGRLNIDWDGLLRVRRVEDLPVSVLQGMQVERGRC